MITDLANHIWQSTIFAAAVAVLAFVVRRKHARIRYRLWWAASVKFLIPFALFQRSAVGLTGYRGANAAAGDRGHAVTQIHEPFAGRPSECYSSTIRRWIVMKLWRSFCPRLGLRRRRHRLDATPTVVARRRLVRTSVPAALTGIELPPTVQARSAHGMLEPAVVGIFRPILLLPAGIQEYLTPRQLRAVIAHELCHVRRGTT
jgi:beta-lactamase regulating signal transducer with metallopeptidase domain